MLPIRAASLISLVCSLGTLVTSPAFATSTQAWVMRSKADFADARLEGVTISPEGRIAIYTAGRLYVGTSPDGRVYRVSGGKPGDAFFSPEAKYIWALIFDDAGNLLVATGQPGRVYRVSSSGKGEVV